MADQNPPRIHEFGPFRYDAGQRLLFRDGELVALEPKAIDTLHALIERRGQVVEKADLMKMVWPDTVVEDVGLARNISLLRKALGEQAGEYVETIPRRGYRFVAGPAAPAAPVSPKGSGAWRWVAAAGLLVALAGLVYWQFYVPSRFLGGGERIAGLAVVPLECLSPEWEPLAFTRGLNEALVAELAKLPGVHVVSPSTVRRYQWVGISTALMGRMLGLELLMEGTVQQVGDRLRVTVRLVDVHTGRLAWAEIYDRPATDAGEAQRAVAAEVSAALAARLAKR